MRARHFVDEQKKAGSNRGKKKQPELDLTRDMQVSKTNQPKRPTQSKGPGAYRQQGSTSMFSKTSDYQSPKIKGNEPASSSDLFRKKPTGPASRFGTPRITPDDKPIISAKPGERPRIEPKGPTKPQYPNAGDDAQRFTVKRDGPYSGRMVPLTPEVQKEIDEEMKERRKKWAQQARANQQKFLRALTNNPILNWAGTLINLGDIAKILWHYEMYLSGWEAVNISPDKGDKPMSVNELAPCDTSSWDPFEDPYLDVEYENPDQTFDVRQSYVIREEDFMPTSFGGNPNLSAILKLSGLWYVTNKGWVTADYATQLDLINTLASGDVTYRTFDNIGPTESTTRYTISRRLGTWVFDIFASALTTAAMASHVIMKISRVVSVVLVGTGVGLPAAIVAALVGGAASWIVASIINGFIKRKERWLRPLTQNIGKYLMGLMTTKSSLSKVCAIRNNILITPLFQRDYGDFSPEREPDLSRPANPLYGDTMNEAANPDADVQQPDLGEQEWMAVIDDEFATMWSEMCGEILAELEEKAASNPKRARQLAIAMQRAKNAASRQMGNQNEIV